MNALEIRQEIAKQREADDRWLVRFVITVVTGLVATGGAIGWLLG